MENSQDLDFCACRYVEELDAPSMMGWRSLAYMAALKADTLQKADPQSETGEAIRAIAEAAWKNYMDLSPKRDEESHNSLAGVVLGWFCKLRSAA